MSTSLPDLSSWHPVPVGATVPAGTTAATVYPDEAVIIGAAAHMAWLDSVLPSVDDALEDGVSA